MLCHSGRVCALCFAQPLLLIPLLLLPSSFYWFIPPVFYILCNIANFFIYKSHDFQIALRATFLGFVFTMGIYIWVLCSLELQAFGLYMCVMSMFHFTEYMGIAIANPSTLCIGSFVLTHSLEYGIAAVSSWIEFGLEFYFCPGIKAYHWITYIGLLICICGDVFRKIAMLTADRNFHHEVQIPIPKQHELVTSGVYKICRHPSYAGWFYWAIATQVLLVNPVCTILYTLVSWQFFDQRILIEEYELLRKYEDQYIQYKKYVHSGIPFIEGFPSSNE